MDGTDMKMNDVLCQLMVLYILWDINHWDFDPSYLCREQIADINGNHGNIMGMGFTCDSGNVGGILGFITVIVSTRWDLNSILQWHDMV